MRRGRRHRLEVSTFPFLAVLLCAMGSLILILLVLDRRAKAAAMERAQKEIAAQQEQRRQQQQQEKARMDQARADRDKLRDEKRLEQQRLVDERQRQIDEKRRAIGVRIQQADAEVEQTRQQINTANAESLAAQAQFESMRRQLLIEKNRLAQQEGAVRAHQAKASEAAQQMDASRSGMARLTADLQLLERTLEDLKTARRREQQTYSVVPYKGKRGDGRKPIYIECTASGLVLHPDRMRIDASLSTKLLAEIRSRYDKLSKPTSGEKTKPYILFLIRPDAIETYYHGTDGLRGEDIDYGYELVDADWILDFPDTDERAQPWMTTQPIKVEPPQVASGARPPQGTHWPRSSGEPGTSATGTPQGSASSVGPMAWQGGHGEGSGSGTPGSGSIAGGHGSGVGGAGSGAAGQWLSSGSGVGGSADGSPSPVGGGAGQPRVGGEGISWIGPPPATGTGSPGGGTGAPGGGTGSPGGGAGATGTGGPSGIGQANPSAGSGGTNPGGSAVSPGTPSAGEGSGEESPSGSLQPPIVPPGSGAKPSTPRRSLGTRDWIIPIECDGTGLTVYPGRQNFPLAELTRGSDTAKALANNVKQAVERRQASVREGEPPYRPIIRFLIRPDGLEALHRAYPLLEPMRLPMFQVELERDDAVDASIYRP